MGRMKKISEKKAYGITVSILPKHKLMIETLEQKLRKNKSKIIQQLIEIEYNIQINKDQL